MGATCSTEDVDEYQQQRAGMRMSGNNNQQPYGDEELGIDGRRREPKAETCQDKCYDFFKVFMDYFCFCICGPFMICKTCCHYCCNGLANSCWKPIDMLAFSCWYEDTQKEFRIKVDEFFKVLNKRKRTLNEACNCNCAMEILDEAEIRLFLSNVTYMKRSLMHNPFNRQNRVLRQVVDWLLEEFREGGTITERSFRNAMVGFFLKQKIGLIDKLIDTFNDHHDRANLMRTAPKQQQQAMWGDPEPVQQQQMPPQQAPMQAPRAPNRGHDNVNVPNPYQNQAQI